MAVNPVLKRVVRDQWGVDVISSDGGAVGLLVTARHLFPNHQAAVVACMKAGINQFLERVQSDVKAALQDGEVTEAEIDNLLRPKFRITIRLGLLDPPEMVPYTKIKDSPEPWNTERDRAVSKRMALESVVLLKNDNGFLSLKKEAIKSIAVIGPLADSVHWDWYGGSPTYTVTPRASWATRPSTRPNPPTSRWSSSATIPPAVRTWRTTGTARWTAAARSPAPCPATGAKDATGRSSRWPRSNW